MHGLINKRNQLGMSAWAWLFVIMVMVGMATAVLKLGPHYIDFRVIQSVVNRLDEGKVHESMARSDIVEYFQKQLRIENVHTPLTQMLKIDRDREQTVLNINYEVREHLFFNIDVVLSFNEVRTYK
jgi:hypothetical protein